MTQEARIDVSQLVASSSAVGLIPYSWAPLILFNLPYTLDSLLQYLPFANGAGDVRRNILDVRTYFSGFLPMDRFKNKVSVYHAF